MISTCAIENTGSLQGRLERLETSQMVTVNMGQEARKWRAKAWNGSKEVDCDASAMNSRVDAVLRTSNVGELYHHSPEGRHLAGCSTSAFAVAAPSGKIESFEVWERRKEVGRRRGLSSALVSRDHVTVSF